MFWDSKEILPVSDSRSLLHSLASIWNLLDIDLSETIQSCQNIKWKCQLFQPYEALTINLFSNNHWTLLNISLCNNFIWCLWHRKSCVKPWIKIIIKIIYISIFYPSGWPLPNGTGESLFVHSMPLNQTQCHYELKIKGRREFVCSAVTSGFLGVIPSVFLQQCVKLLYSH